MCRKSVMSSTDLLRCLKLRLRAPAGNHIAEKLYGVDGNDIERLVEVEEDGEVREAVINDVIEVRKKIAFWRQRSRQFRNT